ncbi:nuclease-related domain-containing protein [Pseudovibrio sp. SPO723]|uniref:nuclease-related domain-containing protein n=1 Tax=Nesiotobacter zosterae TaxID=392721 RepID=UPI0039B56D96
MAILIYLGVRWYKKHPFSLSFKIHPVKAHYGFRRGFAKWTAIRALKRPFAGLFWRSNIKLKDKSGQRSHIDFFAVGPQGIFIIEVKFWSGFITGSKNAQNWYRLSGKSTRPLVNPLTQNAGRIRLISQYTGIPEDRFKNIVLLYGFNKWGGGQLPDGCFFSLKALKRHLVSALSKDSTRLLTDEEVATVAHAMTKATQHVPTASFTTPQQA